MRASTQSPAAHRINFLAALSNAGLLFDMLLDQLKLPRHSNHHQLFQVVINDRIGIPSSTPLGDRKIKWTGAMAVKNSCDLVVELSDTRRGVCVLSFTTQPSMYLAVDIKRLMNWYINMLELLAHDCSVRLHPHSPRRLAAGLDVGAT